MTQPQESSQGFSEPQGLILVCSSPALTWVRDKGAKALLFFFPFEGKRGGEVGEGSTVSPAPQAPS